MAFSGRTLIAVLAAAGILAGCSSTPVDNPSASASASRTTASGTASGATSGPVSQTAVKTVEVDPLNDPNSPLAQRSVYFGFDSYAVDGKYDSMLSAHANYLAKHQARNIVVEGNTDSRGSSEYNLALGQKRSEAVVAKLQLLGVPANRMEAVSFGKEKPVAQGSTEDAWAKNRRADIRYR